MRFMDAVREDMALVGVTVEDADDRTKMENPLLLPTGITRKKK